MTEPIRARRRRADRQEEPMPVGTPFVGEGVQVSERQRVNRRDSACAQRRPSVSEGV